VADKLVTIAQFPNYIDAEMAKQLLADYGIEAVATGENASNIYSGIPALGGFCKLETLESQAKEALKILQSDKKQE
jgi:hypothetical protein